MPTLRIYQEEARQAIFNSWLEYQRTLLVLPTGLGKTIIFSAITKDVISNDKRVLILAHRGELLEQAIDKLKKFDVDATLEKAKFHADESSKVVVASVQTLQQDNRLHAFSKDYFDYIVIDECHHATTNSYKHILDYFDNAKVLGVTATPKRSDTRKLSELFEDVAYSYDIVTAINEGYLCNINIRRCNISIDLSETRITAGDYNASDLGETLNKYLESIIDGIKDYAIGRKTLIFTPTIAIADKFTELLRANGFRAASVNGKSKDRDDIKRDFANGYIDVVCNCMLWTEGFDEPSVDCIINLRPTRSVGLYTQIIGRGLRPADNKENLLVLDFLWHSGRKGFDILSPIDLFVDDSDAEYTEEYLNSGEEFNLLELSDMAHNDRVSAEEALMKKLEMSNNKYFAGRPFREVDNPNFHYRYEIDDKDNMLILDSIAVMDKNIAFLFGQSEGIEWYPVTRWHINEMTTKQSDFLESIGINPQNVIYKGLAANILTQFNKRRNNNLCSIKQYNILKKRGFQNVEKWTNEDAKEVIDILAKNNWRLPYGFKTKNYTPKSFKTKKNK